jgi:hypothetical protein
MTDTSDERTLERRRRGLSTEWLEYPGTGIEVFYDNCAVLYRIDGQIYAVPRQLVTLPPTSEEHHPLWDNWAK